MENAKDLLNDKIARLENHIVLSQESLDKYQELTDKGHSIEAVLTETTRRKNILFNLRNQLKRCQGELDILESL